MQGHLLHELSAPICQHFGPASQGRAAVDWPETIKALWDAQPGRLRVLLLGSSALQIQAGVTESLAWRFELFRVFHWTFAELQAAFGYDLQRYLAFGGYPGAVALEPD